MYLHDFSAKYLLLQQVIGLWVCFVGLLLLAKYKIPHRTLHNVINLLLALGSLVEFGAIVYISVRFAF